MPTTISSNLSSPLSTPSVVTCAINCLTHSTCKNTLMPRLSSRQNCAWVVLKTFLDWSRDVFGELLNVASIVAYSRRKFKVEIRAARRARRAGSTGPVRRVADPFCQRFWEFFDGTVTGRLFKTTAVEITAVDG
ncbi:hypothetical protein K438DRAFT_1768886 [Mycena galopus ATCC 62051]|nr:hypothetical protein K438DRAFT_1784330 [Mycena galopus ATCC 62051]KAF8179524.1 hypothetical protein K438DRAFT_1768886 [Mycena galopus ATCC 62051]